MQPHVSARRAWEGIVAALLLTVFAVFSVLQILSKEQVQEDKERVREVSARKFEQSGIATDDWPQWRGPQRDGVSFADIRTSWPENGPPKLWQKQIGNGFSSIVAAGGKAIAFYLDDEGNETVACMNAGTGESLWTFRYPSKYRNDYGNGPRSTPTIDGDLVFTVGGLGICHCLKLDPTSKDGEFVWKKDLLTEFGAKNPQWGVSASPLVVGDLLVLTPGGPNGNSVIGVNKRTGDVFWKSLDDPAGYSSPMSATIGGETQVICMTGAAIVGLEPVGGKELWRYPWPTDFQVNAATPIIADDYVFVTSGYNQGCALLKIEKKNDAWDAALVYRHKKLNSHFSSPVRVMDHVYGFHDSSFVCMDFRTGKIEWRQRGFGKGSVLAIGNRLGILSEKGEFVLADANPKEFQELARFSFTDERSWTMPTIAANRLYLRNEKIVACFDMK
ncbi:MAG: PQQ-like beta-propeller repeat protein [Gemmataceae bacterium]|nr:PQQ-like beta-propeller repeat protein [Gemmataceae bacterium]